PPRARPPAGSGLGALIPRDLGADHVLDQAGQLGIEELGHPFLVPANALDQLSGLLVTDLVSERLDTRIQRDLDVLLAQLFLGVTQMGLGLMRNDGPCGADLALDRGHGLAGCLPDHAGYARNVGAGGHLAAELLDARGDGALVLTRLGQVLAQALLVALLLGQRYVRCQISLELGLLGVGFAQPLDQLCVTFIQRLSARHRGAPFSVIQLLRVESASCRSTAVRTDSRFRFALS